MKGKPVTTAKKTQIADLYMRGFTYSEIGAVVGLNKSTVYRQIKNDSETIRLLDEMQRNFKNEVMDLCVNEMKEILLDDTISPGLKTTLIATGLKYSGCMTDKVEVTKKEELNLEQLYAKFNI